VSRGISSPRVRLPPPPPPHRRTRPGQYYHHHKTTGSHKPAVPDEAERGTPNHPTEPKLPQRNTPPSPPLSQDNRASLYLSRFDERFSYGITYVSTTHLLLPFLRDYSRVGRPAFSKLSSSSNNLSFASGCNADETQVLEDRILQHAPVSPLIPRFPPPVHSTIPPNALYRTSSPLSSAILHPCTPLPTAPLLVLSATRRPLHYLRRPL